MQIINNDGAFIVSGTMDNTTGLTLLAQSKVSNQVVALWSFDLRVNGATPWSVASTVTIKDTAGNVFATIAVSALTANAVLNEKSPGVTLGAAWFNCGAANQGLVIQPDVAGTGSPIVIRVDGVITAIPSNLVSSPPVAANPADATGDSIPAGVVAPYAGTSVPTGWLFAYGQAVSRATYADLFAAIADTYGVGDGLTTFNLPDLRGRVAGGKDDMGGNAASRLSGGPNGVDGSTLGAAGGAETVTLDITQIPAHEHDYDQPTGSVSVETGGGSAVASIASTATSQTGGGLAHSNCQPTIVLNYIIKT